MPKPPRVKLLKQVKVANTWKLATALFDSKGRVRRDRVRVNGKDEAHPEGSYFGSDPSSVQQDGPHYNRP